MVFLPLKDDNARHHIKFYWVTAAIIAACFTVFLWQTGHSDIEARVTLAHYGLIAGHVTGLKPLPDEYAVIPASLTMVTSMFLHGSWGHLLGNMLFLWIFGDNVEDAMGHFKFLLFYLLCGLGAAFAQIMADPGATIPMIGASGAISGVLGAYLLLHPRSKILVMLFIPIPIKLPAFVVIGLWIALNLSNALSGLGGANPSVAWWAHVGGLIAGLILVGPFKHKHLKLWDWADANNKPLIRIGRKVRVPVGGSRRAMPDRNGENGSGPWGTTPPPGASRFPRDDGEPAVKRRGEKRPGWRLPNSKG